MGRTASSSHRDKSPAPPELRRSRASLFLMRCHSAIFGAKPGSSAPSDPALTAVRTSSAIAVRAAIASTPDMPVASREPDRDEAAAAVGSPPYERNARALAVLAKGSPEMAGQMAHFMAASGAFAHLNTPESRRSLEAWHGPQAGRRGDE